MKKRRKKAKVYCNNKIDALYLKLGDEPPEGVNLDTTSEKRACRQEFPVSKDRFDTSLLLTEWGENTIQGVNLELMNSRKKEKCLFRCTTFGTLPACSGQDN